MSYAEVEIRSTVLANSNISAIIGTRFYPVLAPASASLPFVVFRRTGTEREQTLANPLGVPRTTLEIVSYSETYEEARNISDLVRQVLDGYSGDPETTVIGQVSLENEQDGFINLGADLIPIFQVAQTYDIWWQEA
jgi:hypothetical protein